MVADTDWSARNVRFDEERLLAVYDWDSLALVKECTALGQAAMTWSVTADPGGTEFPDMESVLDYMADYEQARNRRFSAEQTPSGAGGRCVRSRLHPPAVNIHWHFGVSPGMIKTRRADVWRRWVRRCSTFDSAHRPCIHS